MRATFESWLHRQWTKRGLLAWALSPLSVVFLCIARNRRMKTKPHRLPVPVVVVGVLLPDRIRRVADDYPYVGLILFLSLGVRGVEFRILEQGGLVELVPSLFSKLEGIGENRVVERLVSAAQPAEGVLDVDEGDVVGHEHYLVAPDVVVVLGLEIIAAYSRLLQLVQEPDDEGSGAGERVEDLDAGAADGFAKFRLQDIADGVDDEINDLDRGIDDSEFLGR